MSKHIFLILIFVAAAFALGCQTAESPDAETKVNQAIDPKNLPEGFSTSPLPKNGATPGIPDPANVNASAPPAGATPTPGIPDPKTIGKTPMPKGTPPIPGIPDEETLKKQMNQMRTNSNATPPPPDADTPQSATERPRKVRKKDQ